MSVADARSRSLPLRPPLRSSGSRVRYSRVRHRARNRPGGSAIQSDIEARAPRSIHTTDPTWDSPANRGVPGSRSRASSRPRAAPAAWRRRSTVAKSSLGIGSGRNENHRHEQGCDEASYADSGASGREMVSDPIEKSGDRATPDDRVGDGEGIDESSLIEGESKKRSGPEEQDPAFRPVGAIDGREQRQRKHQDQG